MGKLILFRFAEFVFPGHPDKLCDAIADGIVGAAVDRERRALVGVEVGVHTNHVFITGRVACAEAETLDIDSIVKQVYTSAGYSQRWSPQPDVLSIHQAICLETLHGDESAVRGVADDQSVCVGYANHLAEINHLPPEHYLANRLGRRIAALRVDEPELELGPDGKIMVTLCKADDQFVLYALSCSIQHRSMADRIELKRVIRQVVEEEMQSLADHTTNFSPSVPDAISLNGAGQFEIGGPTGDNGLAGKKLAIDSYGPHVPIGGGALSGKDFFKVDRAGALHARRIAKAVVMTGNVPEALVHFSWHPGNKSGEILSISSAIDQDVDPRLWRGLFDLSLTVSGESWGNGIDLIEVARFGHFTDPQLPWERIQFENNCASKPLALSGGPTKSQLGEGERTHVETHN